MLSSFVRAFARARAIPMATAPLFRTVQPLRTFATVQNFLDKDEVTDRVLAILRNFEKVDQAKLTPTSNFKELGLDSLDLVEVCLALEEEFVITIPDEDADRMQSVEQAIEYVTGNPNAK